jgi:acetyltransferase-like isoleucine patch superfamily enzyme
MREAGLQNLNILRKFSNVGTNSIIVPNSILSEGTLIAAGSLFYGESEPWTVYKGNPAVPTKTIDKSKAIKNFEILKNKYGFY